jgi:hypothetical protein
MEIAGTLELLAELSIAVLGFSGVVAVLGRRASGDWSDLDGLRFRVMVRVAALVLALSLLPFPFRSAGFSESSVWGCSSGIGTLFFALFLVLYQQDDDRKGRRLWSEPTVSKAALIYLRCVALAAPLLLGLNATGIVFERTATPYLVASLLLFGASVVSFFRLLEAEVAGSRRAAKEDSPFPAAG